MRLFKKHKAKDKLSLNVGIKECSTCNINIRCEECVYQKENENIKSEIEMLENENQSLRVAANSYKLHYNETSAEAIKEFTERLKNKIKTECNPYGKPTFDYDTSISIMRYIDNLVKEMVGENSEVEE